MLTIERPRTVRDIWRDEHDNGTKNQPHPNSQNHAEACEFSVIYQTITWTPRAIARARNDLARNYESVDYGLEMCLATGDNLPSTGTRENLRLPCFKVGSIFPLSMCCETDPIAHCRQTEKAMLKRLSLSLLLLQLNNYCTTSAAWQHESGKSENPHVRKRLQHSRPMLMQPQPFVAGRKKNEWEVRL